jgi:hypothetical protein
MWKCRAVQNLYNNARHFGIHVLVVAQSGRDVPCEIVEDEIVLCDGSELDRVIKIKTADE